MAAERINSTLLLSHGAEGWEFRFSDTESLILPDATAEAAARRILGIPAPNTAGAAAMAASAAYKEGAA